MQPSLADLDATKLSDEARLALSAGELIAEGTPLPEVAAGLGISLEQLKLCLDKLRAEWGDQAGVLTLPPLTDDEYEALRDSIARYGQIYPVLLDADGQVVDGRARLRACRELGKEPNIDYLPLSVSAEELQALAVAVNVARRHLTVAARRGIIRTELLRDATRSDRAIALHVGVSHHTVASVRKELEQQGLVGKLPTRVGLDGVAQPAHPAQGEPAARGPELPDGLIDVTLRLTREYATALDGGGWLDCRAVRLVLVDAGTYTLEVRE